MKYFLVVTIILGLVVLGLICIFVYIFDFDNDEEKYIDDYSSSNEVIIEYNDTSLVNHPYKDINIVDLSEYNNNEKNNVENKIKEENIQTGYTLLYKHFDHYSFITCIRKISDFSRHFKI
ncbi:hypothetical protein NAPIS_ORF00288 [Vairimorpha apis BRL 01]|uniref:Uncharacterized protein n=1 Tax=Vairimorpha apis BRL 01 TaxID=1037528 RepID=T0MM96_9MICR|nr:hypothetical protein NAPIS_ORF00288 [Vairimorpha apis BRL 01]